MRLTFTVGAGAVAAVALVAFAPRLLSRSADGQLPRLARAATPAPMPSSSVAAPGEKSIVGTLEKYDPTSRLLVLNSGKASLTFHVTSDAAIRQGSRKLKADELASHRGDRVKLRYSEAAGQRRADWIVLAPPPRPAKPARPADTKKQESRS